MAEDDQMDIDFSTAAKGNKEPFKFGNIETSGDKELPCSKRVTDIFRSKYIKGSDEAKLQLEQSSEAATFDGKRIETFQPSPADEGATVGTVGDETQIMESLPIIRSESFEGLDENRSHRSQQASLSQVKVGTISNQKITISHRSTATEKKPDKKCAQTGSKSGALPRPSALPGEQTTASSVEIRSQKSSPNLISQRGSLDSFDTRKFLTKRTRLQHMDVDEGGPVLDGSENEGFDKFSFDDDDDDRLIDHEDMWCVDTDLEDLNVSSNTSTSTLILLELDRRAPPRMGQLSPSEKFLALRATVEKYVRSDAEKERKRLEKDLECSRERISLEFENAASGVYDIVPGAFFLRPFREALEANTGEYKTDCSVSMSF